MQQRTEMGGHDVPPEALARRYPNGIRNLATALQLADRACVIDNSARRPRLLLTRIGGRTKPETNAMPAWVNAAVPESLRQAPS